MSEEPAKRRGLSRLLNFAVRSARNSLAVVGAVAAAGLYNEYRKLTYVDEDDRKKKVLVVPFHRIQLVEHKMRDWRSQLREMELNSEDRIIQLEVREFVDLLHQAAADPNIVALYGIFGHGSQLSNAGWADLEEVRNALRVFRESHRRHAEPNLKHEMQVIPRVEKKPLYAYSNSFKSLSDPTNREYYLASVFSHVHMQSNGELSLLGVMSQQFFLRDFLNKYGIGVHVFKHGEFKNAPNMFTNTRYNRAHRQNVTNIVEEINDTVCDDIGFYRSKALLTSWLKASKKNCTMRRDLWKRLQESGTFPALTAWKAGLIDHMPHRDPLPDLLRSNEKHGTKKDEIKIKWEHQETDFDNFKAEKAVGVREYLRRMSKKKRAEGRRLMWMKYLRSNPTAMRLLSAMGMSEKVLESAKSRDKVALLYARAEGGIDNSTARKLVNSIRKIGEDKETKCVVLRVSSPGGNMSACETILQELKGLGLPVIVSFGNVAASGGYYIASGADRIFASKMTMTGSIGVFALRLDLTEMARQYGISVQHIATGDLAATANPFYPLSRQMKNQISSSVDRCYSQFKTVVADGRQLSQEYVEAIAKGRVWTGKQAKGNGLVDELGGLHRAIAYATRTYTEAPHDTEVVVWPRSEGLLEGLLAAIGELRSEEVRSILAEWVNGVMRKEDISSSSPAASLIEWICRSSTRRFPGAVSGVMLTADENSAIRCLFSELAEKEDAIDPFPPSFWE